MTLANDSLQKQVIKSLQDNISSLNMALESGNSKLQEQIKTLEKEKASLNGEIKKLEKEIADQKQKAKEKDELTKRIDGTVKLIANGSFDDLIVASTKQSVERDKQLVGDHAKAKQVLTDLETYFNTKETLAQKFNVAQMNSARERLSKIKQESKLLDKLKDDVFYYGEYNQELVKTLENILELDGDGQKGIKALSESLQKMKFGEIASELATYMSKHSDYGNYSYLSDVILETLKRKRRDADANITDLLNKLK
jgi:DNA repair exonuclease SbcCD ATPase subunit